MIQIDLSGWPLTAAPDVASIDDDDAFDLILLSISASGSAPSRFSSVPPGVLGVLADEPNEAKAPDPSPNAFDAPAPGEETPPERGDMALKGLVRP